MATFRKRGTTWQAQVRRLGQPTLTRSFKTKPDAELWARQREAEIDRGDLPPATRALKTQTLGVLLERYRDTVTPKKRGAAQERYKLKVLLRHPVAKLSLDKLTAGAIADFRDTRLAVVKGETVRRELAILQHCLELARREWSVPLRSNPVQLVKLPSPGRARDRRTADGELEALLTAAKQSRSWWLPVLIRLAVETGMRRGELLSMRWEDMNMYERTVRLTMTKNGDERTIPLSPRAFDALLKAPRASDRVFPVSANAVRLAWERLKRRAGVAGLRFHDLRHEAISRLFEKGLNVPEVASVSGHRDIRILLRYTHPRAVSIVEKLGKVPLASCTNADSED